MPAISASQSRPTKTVDSTVCSLKARTATAPRPHGDECRCPREAPYLVSPVGDRRAGSNRISPDALNERITGHNLVRMKAWLWSVGTMPLEGMCVSRVHVSHAGAPRPFPPRADAVAQEAEDLSSFSLSTAIAQRAPAAPGNQQFPSLPTTRPGRDDHRPTQKSRDRCAVSSTLSQI